MELKLTLEKFEGPLDLLLHLIEKNKVDIYDIPIAEITDQYIEYLHEMEKLDMDIMSEFLYMAAILLDIKARMLLPVPKEEEEGDPREELAMMLALLKMYRELGGDLRKAKEDVSGRFFRGPAIPDKIMSYKPPVDLVALAEGKGPSDIDMVYSFVLMRAKNKVDPVRAKFGKIKREKISLDAKIEKLRKFATSHKSFKFTDLVEKSSSRDDVIVTFLGILEMMRSGDVRVEQKSLFGEMNIRSLR